MARMIEVVIDSVRVSLTNQQRIVILRELDAERYLPIWIGPYEAEAITIALQDIEVARPQTHDLLKNVLGALNARLVRVEVISLRDDVFYGNLVVEVDGKTIEIDTRPSDALAMAVRAHVPIMATKEVMDNAAIIPEQDIQNQESAPLARATPPQPSEESEDRLSVFEDFLSNINLDNLESPSDEDPGTGPDEPPEPKNPDTQ
jgi:bifunctional DNase/RNase